MSAVRPVGEEELGAASQTLARALHDDPFFAYVVPDDAARRERLPRVIEPLMRFGHLFGRAEATADLAGVALWTPPGIDVTAERAQAAGFGEIADALGRDGLLRYGESMESLQTLTEPHRESEVAYLMAIGVVPERQRQGLGRALLSPMLAFADEHGVPSWLETFEAGTVPFYATLGFSVAIDDVEPVSGLRFLSLRRAPRTMQD